MPVPTSTPGAPLLVLAVVGGTVALSVWRHRASRHVAEEWLRRHRYRVRSLRSPIFRFSHFTPRLTRSSRRAAEFVAEVDDLSLGGTGVVWLRVWSDWLGVPEAEPEVHWERMPAMVDDRSRSLEDRWHGEQVTLLARIAEGEHTFRAEGRTAGDRQAFDSLVEHLLAMSRRQLVSCNPPLMDERGEGQYAAVTGVELTDAGRRFLEQYGSR